MADAREQQQQLAAAITERLNDIEEQLKKQVEKTAEMGRGLSFLAIDVQFMVSRFPVILGFLLAASMVWVAYRRRRLDDAAAILLHAPSPASEVARTIYQYDIAGEPRQRRRWLVVAAGVFSLWIALAGIALVWNHQLGTLAAAGMTLLAIAAVLAAATAGRYLLRDEAADPHGLVPAAAAVIPPQPRTPQT
jgi:hypothetical protein